MTRTAALVLASAVAASIGGGCGHAGSTDSSTTVPTEVLGGTPTTPSERCYQERLEVGGKPVELHMRLRFDPEVGQVTMRVIEKGASADATRTTVMVPDGERFTSIEHGPKGEVRGQGTLIGMPWAWTSWTTDSRRVDGLDEHALTAVTDQWLTIESETRGDGGRVAATDQRRYLAVACMTLGDEPIKTLYPKPKPAATAKKPPTLK